MQALRQELREIYDWLRDRSADAAWKDYLALVHRTMEEHLLAHPQEPACLTKARLHELIAETFRPVILRHSPFCFEMGVRPACNWGGPSRENPSSWLFFRNQALYANDPTWRRVLACQEGPWNLWQAGPFDGDHTSFGYTVVLEGGLEGILSRIDQRLDQTIDDGQRDFLSAAARSCRAVLRVAERFAIAAEAKAETESDPQARLRMLKAAQAIRQVPARPPRTFHEGLTAILFLRETAASLESVGISVLGRPDHLLGRLYEQDLAEGRLTRAEAADLVARWMLPFDIRFRTETSQWPESSTCVDLGGCDAEGRPVFNELTRLFIQIHAAQDLLNPKLNCRYGADSPRAYLDLCAEQVARGRNVFAFYNDDVIVPALCRDGKTPAEARGYVNGGCQEIITEGVEQSGPAYLYADLPRLLLACLTPAGLPRPDGVPASVACAPDFPSFYHAVMDGMRESLRFLVTRSAEVGRVWPSVNPAPFLSASLAGCLESGMDYTAGGTRHRPSALCLVGFGTLADSLLAIREVVFRQGSTSLVDLASALAGDWSEHQALRRRILELPHFGRGHPEADAFAASVARDLLAVTQGCVNERGGPVHPCFFSYSLAKSRGRACGATPDGRYAGTPFSQGIGPGRVVAPGAPTALIQSICAIDLSASPAASVLDLNLPAGDRATTAKAVSALLIGFARLGGQIVQPNCVSARVLRQAQQDPDNHRHLIVRLCGLSARFVALTKADQEEMIARCGPGG